jgi:hypothetical protein
MTDPAPIELTRSQRRHRGLTEAAIRQPEHAGPLRFAFADPPYPGQARRHYGAHEDYGGEVDHRELVDRLARDYPHGWVLCTGARMLPDVLPLCPAGIRVLAWCKPMTPMKPGVSVDFGWEPVLLWGGRRRARRAPMVRDWLLLSPEQWTFKAGGAPKGAVIGMKPRAFCHWLFDCLGARGGDTMDDIFPGSGAVGRAWEEYSAQPDLFAGAEWEDRQERIA